MGTLKLRHIFLLTNSQNVQLNRSDTRYEVLVGRTVPDCFHTTRLQEGCWYCKFCGIGDMLSNWVTNWTITIHIIYVAKAAMNATLVAFL